MVEISLECAIVGQAGTFNVKIDNGKKVSVLMNAIKEKKPDTIKGDVKDLQLFLAKTANDAWLDGTGVEAVMIDEAAAVPVLFDDHGNRQGFVKMNPLLWIKNDQHFRANFQPGEGQIHVLVVVPGDAGVGVASFEPSALPTAVHRHPKRLKRWAAINEMIRQKNQEGNEKTSNSDTNKKRTKRDIDSSIPYSSLSWTDLELILPMEEFNLEASPVPDKVVVELRDRLVEIRKLYGDIYSGKAAKRQVYIVPIFEAVCLMLGDATILVEEDVKGKNVHVHGRFEFVLKRGRKRVSIVVAKRDNIPQGIAQNVAGLEALSDVEGLERTLGIVTNFLEWVFISDDDEKIRWIDDTLKIRGSVPSIESLREIVGMVHGLLVNGT